MDHHQNLCDHFRACRTSDHHVGRRIDCFESETQKVAWSAFASEQGVKLVDRKRSFGSLTLCNANGETHS